MSEFDVHESAFADDLIVHMGESEGVELITLAGPKRYPAIVGTLRIERVLIADGVHEREEDREVCKVSVRCAIGELGPDQQVKVFKYTEGDESTHAAQVFHVRTIDSASHEWTTAQLWREQLAKIQRRGFERAAVTSSGFGG